MEDRAYLSAREAIIEIAVVCVVLLLPSVLQVLSGGMDFSPIDIHRYLGIIFSGLIALVLILFVLHKDGEDLSDIGLRFDRFWQEFFYGLGVLVLIMISLIGFAVLLSLVLAPKVLSDVSEENRKLVVMFGHLNPLLIPPLCIFVGVYEEIWFRGFLISRLKGISKNRLFLVAVSSFIFAVAHVYQSWLNVIVIFMLGVILGYVYIKRGSLLGPIVIHAGFDMISMFTSHIIVRGTAPN